MTLCENRGPVPLPRKTRLVSGVIATTLLFLLLPARARAEGPGRAGIETPESAFARLRALPPKAQAELLDDLRSHVLELRGRSSDLLRLALNDSKPTIRDKAFALLYAVRPHFTHMDVELLIGALSSKDKQTRFHAIALIGESGQEGWTAREDLRKLLRSADTDVAGAAALCLAKIGCRQGPVLADLKRGALDKEKPARFRAECARSLVLLADRSARGILLDLAKLADGLALMTVAMTLPELPGPDKEAFEACKRLVASSNLGVRMAAIWAIGRMCDVSKDSVRLILQSVEHSDAHVRRAALRALVDMRLRDVDWVPALLAVAARDSLGLNQALALDMIARIGRPAIPRLEEVLTGSDDVHLRTRAAHALARIEGGWKVLVKAANSEDRNSRWSACDGMRLLPRERAGDVEASLLKAVTEPSLRPVALMALGNLGISSPRAVRALEGVLKEEEGREEFAVTNVIGLLEAIASHTPDARAVLARATGSKSKRISAAAKDALLRLTERRAPEEPTTRPRPE